MISEINSLNIFDVIETSSIIRRISNETNTQNVESMNSEYEKMLSEQRSWKYAQPRLDATILKHNEPLNALAEIAAC
jgi:hypothetical protein